MPPFRLLDMDMLQAESEGYFTLIWTIENYSLSLRKIRNIELIEQRIKTQFQCESPKFQLDDESSRFDTKWSIFFLPKEDSDQDTIEMEMISIPKKRKDGIMCEVSICDCNGSFMKVETKKVGQDNYNNLTLQFVKNEPVKFNCSLNQNVLETYTNNSSLTLKFRIRPLLTEVLNPRQCYARTIMDVQKIVYPCTLEWEKLKDSMKSLEFLTVRPYSFKMNFYREKEMLMYDILSPGVDTYFKYSNSEISLVDGDGKVVHSALHEFMRYNNSLKRQKLISVRELLDKKTNYLQNGVMHLRCDFFFFRVLDTIKWKEPNMERETILYFNAATRQ